MEGAGEGEDMMLHILANQFIHSSTHIHLPP